MAEEHSQVEFGIAAKLVLHMGIELAITIRIMQHVRRGMRLKPPNSERQADVAKIRPNKIVKRLNFVEVAGLTLRKLGSFRANLGGGFAAVFLKRRIPASHLLPA